MPEAWKVRFAEREKLGHCLGIKLQELVEAVGELEMLRIYLLEFFYRDLLGEQGLKVWLTLYDPHTASRINAYVDDVLDTIRKFARSENERRAMQANLVKTFFGTALSPIEQALKDEERMNPKLVYGTESATDDVPFPKDL